MSRDKFRVVVKALVTCKGEVLVGKKEEGDKPHSGEFHLIGGHVERGEKLEEAIKREVEEETGLEVDVHQIIDTMTFSWLPEDERNGLQVLYHCEADSQEAEPMDDLVEVKWIEPEDLKEEVFELESQRLTQRDNQKKFLEKLKKMPSF